MGGFESFAAIMGGLMDVISVLGFLANPTAARKGYTDQRSAAFGVFVEACWQQHAGIDLGKGRKSSPGIRLGKILHERRNTILAGKRIEPLRIRNGSQTYRLIPSEQEAGRTLRALNGKDPRSL